MSISCAVRNRRDAILVLALTALISSAATGGILYGFRTSIFGGGTTTTITQVIYRGASDITLNVSISSSFGMLLPNGTLQTCNLSEFEIHGVGFGMNFFNATKDYYDDNASGILGLANITTLVNCSSYVMGTIQDYIGTNVSLGSSPTPDTRLNGVNASFNFGSMMVIPGLTLYTNDTYHFTFNATETLMNLLYGALGVNRTTWNNATFFNAHDSLIVNRIILSREGLDHSTLDVTYDGTRMKLGWDVH